MTLASDAQHLVPNAGDPQTEPGPQCAQWSRPLRPSADHGPFTDWCAGCYGQHPVSLNLAVFGLRLVKPHTPSPPQHHYCPVCNEPLLEPSYTWAPHPRCADEGDGDTVWAEGYAPDGWDG